VHFAHLVPLVHSVHFRLKLRAILSSKCTLYICTHLCAPCALYSHIYSKIHQSAQLADLCTLCTLRALLTLCILEPLFLDSASKCTLYICAHCALSLHFVHLEACAPCTFYIHTFLKMHQSASSDLCTLCSFCTLCTLGAHF
jgi:hypothetical protein